MAAPYLGGCAVEMDSEAATDDDAVAWTDSTTADAENTGTESQALFGGCAIPVAAPFAAPVPGCGYGGYGYGGW